VPLQVSTVTDRRPLCSTTRRCAFQAGRRLRDLGWLWPLVLAAKDAGIAAAPCALQPEAPLEATQSQQNGEHDAAPHDNLDHGSLEQRDQGEVPQGGILIENIRARLLIQGSLRCRTCVLRELSSALIIKAERHSPVRLVREANTFRGMISEGSV
jgi:hypothetical protein